MIKKIEKSKPAVEPSQQFKIEKSVPLPPRKRSNAIPYPLREMEVGDSFFIPAIGTLEIRTTQSRIISRARFMTERKFRTASVEGGLRVWRIE